VTTVRRTPGEVLDDPEQIAAALRAAGHTVGSTRRTIIDAIRATNEGFTADELAARLAPIHRTTVYRTLALLEEVGVVHHIHLSHGPAIYERAVLAGSMRHLVCEVCGRHLSVPSAVFDQASRRLEREFDFELEGAHFAIVGRCRSCVHEQ
jgi:Fur family ferric uptake transcriptional regulator